MHLYRFSPKLYNVYKRKCFGFNLYFISLFLDAGGLIVHWHYTSGQSISTIEEKENMLNCIAYSKNASIFAVAGSEPLINIYDGLTHSLKTTLTSGYSYY